MVSTEFDLQPRFAMVCVNNVNRSTAAHERLKSAGLSVCSYGAGRVVTLPGKSSVEARTFEFSTAYSVMHSILQKEDAALYSGNGVLQLLKRNMALKNAPERWQSLSNEQIMDINVVVCLDYAMFLTVLEDILRRIQSGAKLEQLHIICIDTVDTPEEASLGGERVLELCRQLNVPAKELTEEFVKKAVVKLEKELKQEISYMGIHM